jgi:uncharacterized MnhB-related membrane protein
MINALKIRVRNYIILPMLVPHALLRLGLQVISIDPLNQLIFAGNLSLACLKHQMIMFQHQNQRG